MHIVSHLNKHYIQRLPLTTFKLNKTKKHTYKQYTLTALLILYYTLGMVCLNRMFPFDLKL